MDPYERDRTGSIGRRLIFTKILAGIAFIGKNKTIEIIVNSLLVVLFPLVPVIPIEKDVDIKVITQIPNVKLESEEKIDEFKN